jgi:hypothetical protein
MKGIKTVLSLQCGAAQQPHFICSRSKAARNRPTWSLPDGCGVRRARASWNFAVDLLMRLRG